MSLNRTANISLRKSELGVALVARAQCHYKVLTHEEKSYILYPICYKSCVRCRRLEQRREAPTEREAREVI